MLRDPRLWRISRILAIVAGVWFFTVLQLWHTHPAGQLLADLRGAKATTTAVAHSTHSTQTTAVPEPTATQKSVQKVTPLHGHHEHHEAVPDPAPPPRQYAKLAKVCMLYYDNVTVDTIAYEAAIDSHLAHNERFGYRSFVLRRGMLSGYYTKPAYLIYLLLQELVKPVEERLEWLVWHDADLVLMNSQIPLEAFLPPREFSHINMIVTNDLNGLNNGVFFIRVHDWCVRVLAASMSYTVYNPTFSHVSEDQAALDNLIRSDAFKGNVTHVPQRWFNSYHDFGIDDDIPPEWHWANHYFEPGYLLVHFPGTGGHRTNLINQWVKAKAEEGEKYEVPFDKTGLTKEVEKFWKEDAPREQEIQKEYWRHRNLLESVGSRSDRERDKEVEGIERVMKGEPQDKIDEAIHAKKEEHKKIKIENLRKAEEGKIDL
ncbi:hypothetical protein TWF694_002067 [Orbilia ellipsospora]|uniref:Glycosyltransferase family 34 protein n=1 Tax=Orbilia ellipsospora TaxID=2528407 RepID=A0AAV9X5R0_9PEZI